MNTPTKVTAAGMKEIAKLNKDAGAKVKELAEQHRTRRVSFEAKAAGYRHYLDEGERLFIFAPNGNTMTAKMMSNDTVSAPQRGSISHLVGQDTPGMPEGTWIVTENLFLGQWYIKVYYVGPLALAA